jgi:hypothetical protein
MRSGETATLDALLAALTGTGIIGEDTRVPTGDRRPGTVIATGTVETGTGIGTATDAATLDLSPGLARGRTPSRGPGQAPVTAIVTATGVAITAGTGLRAAIVATKEVDAGTD